MRATIHEQGNGFPDAGDYVTEAGAVYRVVALTGPIHTARAGAPNYIYGEVEPADWADLTEAEAAAIIATCVVTGHMPHEQE